jgi:transposase
MSTTNQRSTGKEQFWRRMFRQWHRSGLTIRAFCSEQGLSEPSFYAWRRTLAERDAQAVHFVPVQVVPQEPCVERPDAAASGLELVLAAGRRLRVERGFDAPTLQRLLAVLEEGRPCS